MTAAVAVAAASLLPLSMLLSLRQWHYRGVLRSITSQSQ
jgi:hypothetical protein